MTRPAVATTDPQVAKGPGFVEFVFMIALLMGVNALAVDCMLPALPQIGDALGIASPNTRQWVVTAYLLAFGGAQVVYGPLADRFGRKPVLMAGVGIYVVFSVLAMFAPTFQALIIARIGQGLGSAASRVLAVSIVRDRFSGRTMARVMSLSFLVLLGVPIIAPSMGQAILLIAPWQGIFAVLAFAGTVLMIWAGLRLPETLHPRDRLPIEARRIALAFRSVITNRASLGYTLALTAISGALFGFINSIQQIVYDVFKVPALLTLVFACIAAGIGVATIVNARLVVRLGSRLIGHTALIGLTVTSLIHALVIVGGHETLISFMVLQALTMFCFGLIVGNFGSMAMEPMGHIAGTASSAQGFISTIGGALTGFAIGQRFDGSVMPLALGFSICGIVAMAAVLYAERGRLFVARHRALMPAE